MAVQHVFAVWKLWIYESKNIISNMIIVNSTSAFSIVLFAKIIFNIKCFIVTFNNNIRPNRVVFINE